ncbi:MAG TPA: thioesterase family protein [Steroidobacteraceae bacterium]|nr:thioesterase family protein [Steroidobacteraceae bacterium]
MTGLAIYRTPIAPEWIDYNGHVRDAYYGLMASLAVDALMDQIGIDAHYREQSGCTLYTVEMHIHYLREIGVSDTVDVKARILGADPKRIHAALELTCGESEETAAACEMMLLHVCQTPTVHTAPFPDRIAAAIAELQRATAALPASAPGSRRMELIRR